MPRSRSADLIRPLALDHLLGSLGTYSLMPVLAVLLTRQDPAGGTAAVGAGLFAYNLMAGVSALLVNRWLPRLPYRVAMVAGLLLSASGFGLLGLVHSFPALIALLLVAGFGVNLHLLLIRVLIAESHDDHAGRNRAYSVLQIALNIAGAAGPFAASYLYLTGGGTRRLLSLVAACHLLAAGTLLLRLPAGRRPRPGPTRWPLSRSALAVVVRHRPALRLVATSAIGSFVYAQFYSAFALKVAHDVGAPLPRAMLLAGPAVAIVLWQHGVSVMVNRLLACGARPLTVIADATLVFGVAMVPLGLRLPVVWAGAASVAIFALAEMLFTPMVSTAFAALPLASRLEAISLRQVCWTLGVAAGSLCGGSVYLLARGHGEERMYWLGLAAAAVIATVLVNRGHRRAEPEFARSADGTGGVGEN